jgi:hypothetical protein
MDDNIPYSFFAPILTIMWQAMGFKAIFLCYNVDSAIIRRPPTDRLSHIIHKTKEFGGEVIFVPSFAGYVKGVPEMTSRYFASSLDFDPRAYIMLSDMDMLPMMKDFFDMRSRRPGVVTLWNAFAGPNRVHGSCYIGMTCDTWRKVMGIPRRRHGNESSLVHAVSRQFEVDRVADKPPAEQWAYDQQMFTTLLGGWSRGYQKVSIVDRSSFRRLDRGADFWNFTGPIMNYVECHSARPGHHGSYKDVWTIVATILRTVVDQKDFVLLDQWFKDYLTFPQSEPVSAAIWS